MGLEEEPTGLGSDVGRLLRHLADESRNLIFSVVFLIVVAALSTEFPILVPIVLATAIVRPLRLLLGASTNHTITDSSWRTFSPILAVLPNYRFLSLITLFVALPMANWYAGIGVSWSEFGLFVHVVGAVAVGVLAWSEALTTKNFYFDRWHPIERAAPLAAGAWAILNPSAVPLFLLLHRGNITQYLYPEISAFNVTHSSLPYTVLHVVSAFAFVGLAFEVQPLMVAFLLFCGYAAHYFHCGIEKLKFGPVYYVVHNNPFNLLLNAKVCGWLPSLDEERLLTAGKYSTRLKPLMNSWVIATEVGVVLMFVHVRAAVLFLCLSVLLHTMIFLFTGDLFWKWIAVELTMLVGLFHVPGEVPAMFGQWEYMALSILFVVAATAWMQPKQLGWLDSPYLEYFEIKGKLREDGSTELVHSNVFRPYDFYLTQGITGAFTFLGETPKFTYSLGNVKDIGLHDQIRDSILSGSPDREEARELAYDYGDYSYDQAETEQLRLMLKHFFEVHDRSWMDRLLRMISSPREFYTPGFSDVKSYAGIPEYRRIRMYRIDGIWTSDGFYEIRRKELFTFST